MCEVDDPVAALEKFTVSAVDGRRRHEIPDVVTAWCIIRRATGTSR